MSADSLDVDRERGTVRWRHRGRPVSARVPGLADAAFDRVSGRVVALSGAGEGRLLLIEPDGSPAGSIDPPTGYAMSHFAPGPEGLMVVCQGEAPADGWPDWHFTVDGRNASLSRAGPAY